MQTPLAQKRLPGPLQGWWVLPLASSLLVGPLQGTGHCGCLAVLDDASMGQLKREGGFRNNPVVLRNELGTKLFLTGRRVDGSMAVATLSVKGLIVQEIAGARPILDDQSNVICSIVNHHDLVFSNGFSIPIYFTNAATGRTTASLFGFSPGGRYFFLNQGSDQGLSAEWASAPQPLAFLAEGGTNMGESYPVWAGVFRANRPKVPLLRLPRDFLATSIFCRSNEVLVSGHRYLFSPDFAPSRTDLVRVELCGLVFHLEDSRSMLAARFDLRGFGAVRDMDPATGALLVEGEADMSRKWGVLQPSTRNYRSLGFCKPYGFFLAPDFSDYLERHFHVKRRAF